MDPLTEASEKEVLRGVLDCELLVIDDLGAEKQSAWVRDTIAFILNDRYKNERTVIITTNLRDEARAEGETYSAVKERECREFQERSQSPEYV